MLRRLADQVLLSFGWRRAAIACLAGAASALAMAPFHLWPILFVTFPVLVWLIDGAAAGRWGRIGAAAVSGWWFGFGYFVAGLYWLGIAFLVDANTFAWLMPLAVVGLPAGLAFFTAFGTALASALWVKGPVRILALAASLTLVEYLRGTILSGFPWNAFGYALTAPLALAQSASILGIWGLTLLAVAIFASPATLADEGKRKWWPLAAGVCVLALMMGYGLVRLDRNPTQYVAGPKLRLMQPNLPQDVKFNYDAKAEVMKRYLTLSERSSSPEVRGLKDVTHLFWPESAFPFLLTREADAMAQIAELLPPGTVLITGAARLSEPSAGRPPQAFNAIYAIGDDGTVLSSYDKVHLVPFGEYLPMQDLLESIGLQQLTKVRGGFSAGDRRRLFTIPGLPPAVPLVCYEVIFSGDAVPAGERPAWMLNVTNDGWFGNSTGPYQHFLQSRVRAIEEGLPLVRVANTGISAVVDAYGRSIAQLGLGIAGNLDAPLPRAIAPTVFARFGHGISLALLLVAFGISLRRRLAADS